MVRFLAMVLPAFVSVGFLEHMEDSEYSVFQFVKILMRSMFWINFGTLLVCYYVMGVEDSVYDSFASNIFLLHYLECSFVFSILFPILKYRVAPLFSIKIRKKEN